MSNLFRAVLLLGFLLTTNATAADPKTEIEAVLGYFAEMWNEGDLNAVRSYYHRDFVLVTAEGILSVGQRLGDLEAIMEPGKDHGELSFSEYGQAVGGRARHGLRPFQPEVQRQHRAEFLIYHRLCQNAFWLEGDPDSRLARIIHQGSGICGVAGETKGSAVAEPFIIQHGKNQSLNFTSCRL